MRYMKNTKLYGTAVIIFFILISLFSQYGLSLKSVQESVQNPSISWVSQYHINIAESASIPYSSSSITIYHDTIYVGGNGSVYAFNQFNGALIWSFDSNILSIMFNTTPLVYGNVVVIAGNDPVLQHSGTSVYNSALYWLNSSTGAILGTYNFTYPGAKNQYVYATSPLGGVKPYFYVVIDGNNAGIKNIYEFSTQSYSNYVLQDQHGTGSVSRKGLWYNNSLYLSFNYESVGNSSIFYSLNGSSLSNNNYSPSAYQSKNVNFFASPSIISSTANTTVRFYSSNYSSSHYTPYVDIFTYNLTPVKMIKLAEYGYINVNPYIYKNNTYVIVNNYTSSAIYNVTTNKSVFITHIGGTVKSICGTGNILYLSLSNGSLSSYNLTDKKFLWSYNISISSSTIRYFNGTIYGILQNGSLFAVKNGIANISINAPSYVNSNSNVSIIFHVYWKNLYGNFINASHYPVLISSSSNRSFANGSDKITVFTDQYGNGAISLHAPYTKSGMIIVLQFSTNMSYNETYLYPFTNTTEIIHVNPAQYLSKISIKYNLSADNITGDGNISLSLSGFNNTTHLNNVNFSVKSSNQNFSVLFIGKNGNDTISYYNISYTGNSSTFALTLLTINASKNGYINSSIILPIYEVPLKPSKSTSKNNTNSSMLIGTSNNDYLYILIIALISAMVIIVVLVAALIESTKRVYVKNNTSDLSMISSLFEGKSEMPYQEFKKKVILHKLTDKKNFVMMFNAAVAEGLITNENNTVKLEISNKIKKIEKGYVYLIASKKMTKAYSILSWLIYNNMDALCISRMPAVKLFSKYKLPIERIKVLWLTNEDGINIKKPKELEKLSLTMTQFIKSIDNGVVLLDNLEYLITNNNFLSILKLIQGIKDQIATKNIVVLISIDPDSVDKQSYALLEREVEEVI